MNIERKKEVVWKDGEWRGGEWKGDIWENGIFRQGIFSGKIWRNGVFKGGVFNGHTWENGIWKGGVWLGEIWIRGYDVYGNFLEIPPDVWPEDQSLLCFQNDEFNAFKEYKDHFNFSISTENNIFYKQSLLKARHIRREGVFIFHPDLEPNKKIKEEKSALFRTFMKCLENYDLSAAEKMIEEAKAKE